MLVALAVWCNQAYMQAGLSALWNHAQCVARCNVSMCKLQRLSDLVVSHWCRWVKANSSELRGYSTTQTDGPNGQPIGPRAQSVWLYVVPWGLYKELKYVWEM